MAVENSSTKQCTKCGDVKPLSEFFKDRQKRDGLTSHCRTCKRDALNKYQRNNAEKVRRYKSAWVARRGESYREVLRQWYQRNKDAKDAASKKWASENRARLNELARARYKKDRNAHIQSVYKWRKNNPEHFRGIDHAYRARKRAADGVWSKGDVIRLLERQRGRCAVCKTKLTKSYNVDHIVPLARGGSNYPTNLQLLCKSCNSSKGCKDPIEFMRQRGYIL